MNPKLYYMKLNLIFTLAFVFAILNVNGQSSSFDEIIYIERNQYAPDHHNTETLFQVGEICTEKFDGGTYLKALNITTGKERVIIDSPEGVVRDPEISFDGKKIIFSWRKNKNDFYHIYEVDADGSNIRQLTFAEGVSDIDPLYLPDGGIVFSASREPKYCMCNRHIMCNLYRMDGDGANITQIGKSTLFEGHSALLNDGRIIYDRWEYVDRNFADAQALWTVNPDGTKHAIYYGNNTQSPDGIIDARPIPGSDLVLAIFGACHDRPWGALALIDRRKGVDDAEPVVQTWPSHVRDWIGSEFGCDKFAQTPTRYEDPFPIDENNYLVSRAIRVDSIRKEYKMGIYIVSRTEEDKLIKEGGKSLFDPMPLAPRFKPSAIPFAREFGDAPGVFYVQNVYEGTNMKGIELGEVKYLRIIESPEKRTWGIAGWGGQGEQAPGMNWHSFENKRILGEVPVEADGSAYFEVPAGKFVYFQLLDKNKKMVQSMRSGTVALSGETNGCVGCHENRLSIPIPKGNQPIALKSKPQKMNGWMGKTDFFSYTKEIQPVFDKHCMECHDFDKTNREKLVLSGDRNPFFNASYVNLYVTKNIKPIGAGGANIQEPKSWGSYPSKLTEIIDSKHHGVKLTVAEKQRLYTWMDINCVYYPVYESAYEANLAGRSPLNGEEISELSKLCGVDIGGLNGHWRTLTAQVAFERPEESPCLDGIRSDVEKYNKAVSIIALGGKRLKEKPRADMDGFVPGERHLKQLENYARLLENEVKNTKAIEEGRKNYEKL